MRQLQVDGRLQPGQHGVHGFWDEAADAAPGDLEQQAVPEALAMTITKERRVADTASIQSLIDGVLLII